MNPLAPRRIFLVLILVALAALVAPLSAGASTSAPAEERALANGLKVVLQENHCSPVVAIEVWVKAGSRYEADSQAGISHLIEHMMFKGTRRRAPGQMAKLIEASGGSVNAYTSFDHTVYYAVLAARDLPLGLDVLADALSNSLFDPTEMEREKKVVIEEIRQRDDSPDNRLSEELFATAYKTHPYRRPVIGSENKVASFSRGDILKYLARRYRPENMTLVVVGDVPAEAAWPLLEKTFGQMQLADAGGEGEQAGTAIPSEPAQTASRVLSLGDDVNESYLEVAFHIPGVADDDIYALDVLSEVLGDGASSRLYRSVKQERELVHSIDASSFTPTDPGLFFISCALEAAKAPAALAALLEEAFRLQMEVPAAEEMAKARLSTEASFLRGRETVEGRARQLGYFQTVRGDWRLEEDYLARVRATKPEDVRRVAEKYLRASNMTVALLAPKGQETLLKEQVVAAAVGKALEAAAKVATPAARAGYPSPQAVVVKQVLPNGIDLLVKENPGSGTVVVRAVVMGGQRYEDPAWAGVANFAAAMLTKGTASKDARRMATLIDSMAAGISGFSGRNSMGLSGDFLAERFDEGLALFAEALRFPAFDPAEVEKMRTLVLAGIKSREDELTQVVMDLFNATLYGPHPYGRTLLGTQESVQGLKREDLAAFWARYAQPKGMVISVVGDIDAEHACRKVAELLGDWRGEPGSPPVVAAQQPLRCVTKVSRARDARNQVNLLLGFRGLTLTDPDRYALDVLDAALSSQGGRLFVRLRDELSLAYSVSCFSSEGIEPGSFAVFIATSPDKRERAVGEIIQQLKQARAGLAPEELERARRFLVGNYLIGLQSNSAQASQMSLDELYGLGYDYGARYAAEIEKVSLADVKRVARKYIDLKRYLQAEVGPAAALPHGGKLP
ncbi:MAG: pitrilysin family protein [Pseudomonadota bacterium]